ncbi:serine protease [Bacillus sp. 3255]|uniref:S1 family peptidase n=1 Tax=Bacillus sp. 3255 TaxID=2817904 RepID=UPI0028620A25|nr:serine protease [Bacillus sp. 3255]MDR6883036.1 hypothetical protein [Bacillus sp. 3255]
MPNNLGLSEQLLYSTARIECTLANGTSTGTGFFFSFDVDDGPLKIPVVVTNKHVIENSVTGRILFNVADSEGNPVDTEHYPIALDNFESRWFLHPEPEVDLCVMPIGPYVNYASHHGEKLFYRTLGKQYIPSFEQLNELGVMEEITMVGYPSGLWDAVNNKPIVRRGITATHPKLNYNGVEEFLIDAACYPGSSGSPVMIVNEGSFTNRAGFQMGVNRIFLLGILYAGPQFTATGQIRMQNIPNRPVSVSHIPMNLGNVIKAHKLLDFEEMLIQLYKSSPQQN